MDRVRAGRKQTEAENPHESQGLLSQSCERTERRSEHCSGMACPTIHMLCAAQSSKWKSKKQLLFNCSNLLQNQLGYTKGYGEGGWYTDAEGGKFIWQHLHRQIQFKRFLCPKPYICACLPASIPFPAATYICSALSLLEIQVNKYVKKKQEHQEHTINYLPFPHL